MKEIDYLQKYKDKIAKKDLMLLAEDYPVQYLVGHVDFLQYRILVNENVLIPRFETEYFVTKIVDYLQQYQLKTILEIGTGSGCIAIALAKMMKVNMTAIDISKKALKVARKNAKLNNCNIKFLVSDLFENIDDKYDVIVSNPPYLDVDDCVMLKVKKYEPHAALFADNNGLMIIENILKSAPRYLNEKSLLALEIGEKQANSVKKIAKKHFPMAKVLIEEDLCGKDRYVFIINN